MNVEQFDAGNAGIARGLLLYQAPACLISVVLRLAGFPEHLQIEQQFAP